MKVILSGVGLLITLMLVLFAIGFLGDYLGLMHMSFFAPRVEKVRYDTFKQSQTYNDGMIRDLEDIQREYLKATPDQKAALGAIAIHRFEVYDINRLPPNLQSFYYTIKGQQ